MKNKKWFQSGLVYGLIVLGAILVIYSFAPTINTNEISVSEVIQKAQRGEIQEIIVRENELTIIPFRQSDSLKQYTSRIGNDTDILSILADNNVPVGSDSGILVSYKGSGGFSNLFGLLINFLPLIFFGALIIFMMRQAQGGNNQTMSFGRSKAKMTNMSKPTVTFQDVAGVEESKEELVEIVEFLKHPEKFQALGARIPTGVLLVGQPGTGKTLLSRAVAGEAGVPFFHISGSEFVEMFVGVGASRVRDLFEQAKKNAPCIIFVDEIDAVGRHRGAGLGGGHDEREQTLNQILVEMDGFEKNTNIIVLAATNRPDILDPALLRPGRFDRRVTLDLPDISGRKAILDVHSAGKPLDKKIDMDALAKETPGFSGADLSNLVNEAAILAARNNQKSIFMEQFEEAIEIVQAGPQRKSKVISTREKEMTAYHEAGHALCGWLLPHADKVHKISIISRGNMGGHTTLLPEEDRSLWTKNQFTDMMAVMMGGRVAEEQIFAEVTTGASNDIERATKVALEMVKRYGMSPNLGPRTFGKRQEMVFLGNQSNEERDYGDKIAEEIDQEVHSLISWAYDKANELIEEHKPKLVQIAEYLIEYESVSGENLDKLFNSIDGTDELNSEKTTPDPTPDPKPYTPGAPKISPGGQAAPSMPFTNDSVD
jgi:cell division protease FtsH